jgi:hypothetical protein
VFQRLVNSKWTSQFPLTEFFLRSSNYSVGKLIFFNDVGIRTCFFNVILNRLIPIHNLTTFRPKIYFIIFSSSSLWSLQVVLFQSCKVMYKIVVLCILILHLLERRGVSFESICLPLFYDDLNPLVAMIAVDAV